MRKVTDGPREEGGMGRGRGLLEKQLRLCVHFGVAVGHPGGAV